MSLVDFLFPQQAAASHLRSIRDQNAESDELERLKFLRQSATVEALQTRINGLEDDIGYLTLVLSSLISNLDEKGILKQADVKRQISELDEIDGVRNGKINIQLLKYLINQASQ